MARKKRFVTRERVAVIGDALLLTSAAYGLTVGLGALLIAPGGDPRPGTEWMVAVSSIVSLLVSVSTPIGVWVAHGRRLSLAAVFGGLVGAFCSGFVLLALAAVAAVVDLLFGPVIDSELVGLLVVLGLVCCAYLAVVGWLIADAIRDIGPRYRMHPGIDAARLVAVAIVAALIMGTVWWVRNRPGDESWEILVFALVAGIGGALAVAGALVLSSLTSGQRRVDRGAADDSSATATTSRSG